MSYTLPTNSESAPTQTADIGHEGTRDGTLYWTLSLYIDANTIKKFLPVDAPDGPHHEHATNITRLFRKAQLQHYPSFALRNAIDPLFNDIADRERLGQVHDFLLAAGVNGWATTTDRSSNGTLEGAAEDVRTSRTKLQFRIPAQFSWMTEGEKFSCRLAATEDDPSLIRDVYLRRFWFAHSDGALSYHLSFSHFYGDRHGPETYYFLSLLQKLAVPKEFSLSSARLQELNHKADHSDAEPYGFSVFDPELGIDPLDKIMVTNATGAGTPAARFWPFIKELCARDAKILFADVFGAPQIAGIAGLLDTSLVDVIEVPGLRIPRSRSLFHIKDERFFNRLLPLYEETGERLPRKRTVQELCYRPYQDRLAQERANARTVVIGAGAKFLNWDWLTRRSDYDEALADGWFCEDEQGVHTIKDPAVLEKAMRKGACWQVKDIGADNDVHALSPPIRHHIPSFETGRSDCIDYLFLAGFNQNIIDWLNQDTSEILDSTDPIYPTDESQMDEAFFVRFANHRALITYVAESRSLDVGNEYIGTCPYAFLIHILAMHNEFLSRGHEERAARDIETISAELKIQTPDFAKVEDLINDLKSANYAVFETHRYLNIFRYDTERDVFAKLEQLRGIDRRNATVVKAIQSLEDKSSDLESRRNTVQKELEDRRSRTLNQVGFAIGIVTGVGILFTASDYIKENPLGYVQKLGLDPDDVGNFLGTIAWTVAIVGFWSLCVYSAAKLFNGLKKFFRKKNP